MQIRADQVKAFEREAWRHFEVEMLEHSKSFSPRLTAHLADKQLLFALRSTMARAWTYGFTNRGPIRLFIELTFLWGSSFDTDPQYSILGNILRDSADQMVRAEKMHEEHNSYLAEVSGARAIHERNYLREISILIQRTLPFSLGNFDADLRRELKRMFPQKIHYIGEAGATKLIGEGKAQAATYGFHAVSQITLMVTLMLAFGHGCTNDPHYPWIARILQDERIVSPADRAERLKIQMVSRLTHILDDADSGVQR